MKMAKLLTVVALFLTGEMTWSGPGKEKNSPLDLKGKTLQEVFGELLPGMGAKAIEARSLPQQRWQDICFRAGAPGNESLRKEACLLMVRKLGAETPGPARIWLVKQLQHIGGVECVEAVAALLNDKDDLVRDAAVRCLAHNPSPQATGKLLAGLPDSSGKAKVGLLNALGHRADQTALQAVAQELFGAEEAVAVAAARALGQIGTAKSARALDAALPRAKGQLRVAIGDAYLLQADRLLKQGKLALAAAIYKKLNRPEEPRPIRLAALHGVLKSAGDQAGALILHILAGADADAQDIAIGLIETLGAGALGPLAAGMDKLPAPSQVLVLNALAARGDKAQLPIALAAAGSKDPDLQRAGILALARLGDASVVSLLIETMFSRANLAGAASESLARLAGKGVNDKIVATLKEEKTAGRRALLIQVLERRKAGNAVPLFLQAALSEDPALKASAFAALKSLAQPKHVPEMLQAFLKTDKGKDRDQAEQAILFVCRQIDEPEKRAESVLAMLKAAGKADKIVLLPFLGRLGGARALAAIKEALAGTDPDLSLAGFLGLCNWPDSAVAGDLLELAQKASDKNQRLLALRALIRVNAVPGPAANADRLGLFKKAMELAGRLEERRMVLEGLISVKDIRTLRYVLSYLDSKDLAQQACRTIVELAHSRKLREPNQAEFNKALDRVIAICQDSILVDRARQYKQ